MARRRRDLRPEERELWQRIERTAHPLHPARNPPPAPKPKPEPPKPVAETPPVDLSGFSLGGKAPAKAADHRLQPKLAERLSSQPVRMDAKTHRRMTRGRMEVEGRIDLHGLTLAEAHPRLMSFVFSAHTSGKRLILVITGKGRDRDDGGPIPERRGILRHQVPHWLNGGALRPVVMQVTTAHQRHGGSGAFYVYLRRK
ncbi:Smr/MutS family protein [Palleronia sp.]|uniref:Smr/MutS family protein n=1 Tax=Palleronia sp. TaxID=1940284 RepID=UPI0035C7FB5D